MGRLFIIDQSLCSQGGHHLDYASCVARVACEQNLETIVGANRRFNRPSESAVDAIHENAKVVPSFRNTTYQKVSWLAGLRHLKRVGSAAQFEDRKQVRASVLKRVFDKRRFRVFRKKRRNVIAQFAADCDRFFAASVDGEFQPDDNIFLATVSELELMGLAIYLCNNPSSRAATWHLQFHFNLFEGRTPEFDSQTEVQRKIRGCFLAALSRIPDHDLKFYCTSDELVEQYSRLKVADFWRLPYPVNQRFAPHSVSRSMPRIRSESSSLKTAVPSLALPEEQPSFQKSDDGQPAEPPKLAQTNGPVRVVVPGELRREKGGVAHLQNVVDELWDDYLSNGRLQIATQRPKKKLFRGEKLELRLPQSVETVCGEPIIDYTRHPLPETDYCEFIRGADFGLLLHDSRAYYSRRAGVLGELLSCGKPVVVPAGCWLAHQLQEPQFQHIDSLVKQLPHSRTVELKEMRFSSSNAPLSGGAVSFDRGRHPFVANSSKESTENMAVLSFDWQHPVSRGVDARIKCTERRSDGSIETSTQVVGHRFSAGKCQAIFRIDFGGDEVSFEIENAFDDSTAVIRNLTVDYYCAAKPQEVPLGNFGLIYPDADSIGQTVAELVEHLDHFRFEAQKFSLRWWNSHDPSRTLNYLVNESNRKHYVA